MISKTNQFIFFEQSIYKTPKRTKTKVVISKSNQIIVLNNQLIQINSKKNKVRVVIPKMDQLTSLQGWSNSGEMQQTQW